jgi:hypothetical protein
MTRSATIGTAVVVLACLTACGSNAGDQGTNSVAATTTPPQPQLLLTFDDQEPGPAEGRQIQGQGSAAVTVTLLNRNKLRMTFEEGNEGSMALRFPPYAGQATGSFGALRIEPEEWLSPGSSEFTFGADVRLDAVSNCSELDNGDNVIQRGLFSDPAQYKIQVDKHHASCVVRGTEGSVTAKSKAALSPAKWYRLDCRRLDQTVTLTVAELGSTEPPSVVDKTGPIGPLDLTGAEPVAVGAKIGSDGQIPESSTDQFNGVIDNITYLRN